MDDRGTARLATGGRSSVVAVPETSFAGHVQSGLGEDIDDYRYMAPELQSPEEHDVEGIDKLATKESDVYGMGMVVYRVSSHRLISPGTGIKSHVGPPLGLDGERAVLRMRHSHDTGKDTDRGTSPETVWG